MNAQQILEAIRETTTDAREILAALEDGAALSALGVTDDEKEEVEIAHAQIKFDDNSTMVVDGPIFTAHDNKE